MKSCKLTRGEYNIREKSDGFKHSNLSKEQIHVFLNKCFQKSKPVLIFYDLTLMCAGWDYGK